MSYSDQVMAILHEIPSRFGRLISLAARWEPASDRYRDHELALRFGEGEIDRVLRNAHLHAFLEWLQIPLARQTEDLSDFVSDPPMSCWHLLLSIKPGTYECLVPGDATSAERKLFMSDIGLVMAIVWKQREQHRLTPTVAPLAYSHSCPTVIE